MDRATLEALLREPEPHETHQLRISALLLEATASLESAAQHWQPPFGVGSRRAAELRQRRNEAARMAMSPLRAALCHYMAKLPQFDVARPRREREDYSAIYALSPGWDWDPKRPPRDARISSHQTERAISLLLRAHALLACEPPGVRKWNRTLGPGFSLPTEHSVGDLIEAIAEHPAARNARSLMPVGALDAAAAFGLAAIIARAQAASCDDPGEIYARPRELAAFFRRSSDRWAEAARGLSSAERACREAADAKCSISPAPIPSIGMQWGVDADDEWRDTPVTIVTIAAMRELVIGLLERMRVFEDADATALAISLSSRLRDDQELIPLP